MKYLDFVLMIDKNNHPCCPINNGKARYLLKNDKAKVRSIDEDRGEIIFDHMDYSGTATVTATSFSEMAIDFNVLTYNVLPTAKGKKIIENIYKLIDKKLDFKGLSLYK